MALNTNPNEVHSNLRVIFHVDMDAFFASVEQLDHPQWKGRPVIVGGRPQSRGVVCAASYEARRFGVRSAMSSARALALCPGGLFIPPRMERYREVSMKIMDLLGAYCRVMEKVSVDEAYLEVGTAEGHADPNVYLQQYVRVARDLKNEIKQKVGLAASVGIASNKFLAKLASDYGKPDGLILIPERDKGLFLRGMNIEAVHGVGRVTALKLKDAGIHTIGDVQDKKADIKSILGVRQGEHLEQLAWGEDHRPVEMDVGIRSISSETTFPQDTSDRGVLRKTLKDHAMDIEKRLIDKDLFAVTVQVKVRYGDFKTFTRQLTLPDPTQNAGLIFRSACHLLARHKLVDRPLRLLGLGVDRLEQPTALQLPLPFHVKE